MGWREWFGFSKPRDAPDVELPKIEDNVRDSGGVFVFGMTNSGERVDEKSALQIATVYACVRLLAETIASLPLHLYRFTEKGDGKERATDHPLYKILYRQANPEMTSFKTATCSIPITLIPMKCRVSTTKTSSFSGMRYCIYQDWDSMVWLAFLLLP